MKVGDAYRATTSRRDVWHVVTWSHYGAENVDEFITYINIVRVLLFMEFRGYEESPIRTPGIPSTRESVLAQSRLAMLVSQTPKTYLNTSVPHSSGSISGPYISMTKEK